MKLLIVKSSSLGDIVHTFPALSYLRRRYPSAQIDWVVEKRFSQLIDAHPEVDRVLTIESKKWCQAPFKHRLELHAFRRSLRDTTYDVIFDLQGNLKSSGILFQSKGKVKVGFGWKTVSEWPNALFTTTKINPPIGRNIREDYLAIVQNYFNDSNFFEIKPFQLRISEEEKREVDEILQKAVLVCPGAAWPNKQLGVDSLLSFLKYYNQEPYLFSWGREEEREKAFYLASHFSRGYVLKHYSLAVLQHVMAKCKVVIAMDSLPLHLCATTPTASISFFGPTSAKKYGPPGKEHMAFQGRCPYKVTFEKRCPKLRTCSSGACMDNLL